MTRTLAKLLAALPLRPEDFAREAALVGEEDWPRLFDLAERHGVAEIVERALLAAGLELPAPFAEGRIPRRAAELLWTGRSLDALRGIVQAFEAANVRACCLKGPLLGERLHGDPALRPSADLDLAVARADLPAAEHILEGLGYAASDAVPERRYQLRRHCHLRFGKAGQPDAELHFGLLASFGVRVPTEPFLARAEAFESRAGGFSALVLSPEDEFVFLAAHAAKHLFEKLLWLHELKLFAMRHPGLDWALVEERARGAGVLVACRFAMDFARDNLGAPLPEEPWSLTPGQRARLRFAKGAFGWESIPKTVAGTVPRRLFYQTILCDRARGGARHALGHLWRLAARRAKRPFGKIARPSARVSEQAP